MGTENFKGASVRSVAGPAAIAREESGAREAAAESSRAVPTRRYHSRVFTTL